MTMSTEKKPSLSLSTLANGLLTGFWIMNAILWGQYLSALELTVAFLCAVCAFGVWQQERWGYFMAAALAFGLMRLAMDKYSGVYEEEFKATARGIYTLVIPWALWLHEVKAKTTQSNH